MISQKNMVIRIFVSIIFLVFISCDNTDYQVLKVDSKNGVLEVLNSDYVLDSIAFEKDDKLIFSMSLNDKTTGNSKLNLTRPENTYKIHKSEIDFKDCEGSGGIAFIRKKGFSGNITYDVQKQKKHYQEVQQFWFNYLPCQDSIIEINALRRLK